MNIYLNSKEEKKYKNFTGFEPGHSRVALQCTNHENTRALSISE